MKNISLGLVILPLLIISCTNDTIDTTYAFDSKASGKKSEKKESLLHNLTPENPANIYDYAGKLHNAFLDLYLSGNYQHNTIAQISKRIQKIANGNSDGTLLKLQPMVSKNLEEIQKIVKNPEAALQDAISNASMADEAKNSLFNFMNAALFWENEEYEAIYQSIISYESSVINNDEFSDEDKQIILTVSSITRYSLYYNKKRKDEDWETSVGNRVGAVGGDVKSSFSTISRSLIAGIMINNLVANR
ncbi:hypothetical protein [Flavobacterium xinjiangense]|uniref:Uncharacterized protein n=1 Tax=Flavobacterium xinjiangense TaxID=178356 RepID=A0A1M7PT99_9FLAO|nr:hypothetical protein [Flavobacterium xinjiangense]SHN20708.1 hypothetical protein SAMN05216269_12232 [Flavobacterium xinjiangense]